tara:strand:- start:20031 stop:20759 length:729 start_codon:yes stop_codon:yes gene_type:complete
MSNLNEICVGLITSCSKNYAERSKNILNTWGKDIEHIYFFTDCENKDYRYLNLTKNNFLSSNKEKMIKGILNLYEMNLDCKYYLLGDDDNYFFIKNILNFCKKNITENELTFYGRDIFNWKIGYYDNARAMNHGAHSAGDTLDYCGGGGILFNCKSFKKMGEYIKNNYNKIMEKFPRYADVCMGYICKYSSIKFIPEDRFHTHCYVSFYEEDYKEEKIKSYLEDQFSFHRITHEDHYKFLNI